MEKRKKLDEKTKADIIRSCKTYSIKRVAEDYGVHPSTVRRILKEDLDKRVMATRAFQKHVDEVSDTLRWLIQGFKLLRAALEHFKQECPEFKYLRDWQDITEQDIAKGITSNMELLANSRTPHVPSKCPVCQSIKKGLKGSD